MVKIKDLSELKDKKDELLNKFNGALPSYLEEYFDEEELKKIEAEFYSKKLRAKYSNSVEERLDYKKKETDDFWKNNIAEIIKKPKTTLNAIYEEPSKAEDRIEDEKPLSEVERLIFKQACKENMYFFAVRYFPHYLKKRSSELHRYLYKTFSFELNKKRTKGMKLAIAAPRFNAKSSIVSCILILWCIVYDKKKFILMVSDTADQAKDFLTDVKNELQFNEMLLADFPQSCGKGETWRLDDIVTKNNVKVMALGTGNKIRGRRFGIHRPDLFVGDDLENSEMVRSKTQRDFIRYDWFDKDVAYVGGEKGSNTDFIVVGTVLGKDSLLNALLDPKEYPDWRNKRFQAVIDFSDSGLWDDWEAILKDRFNDDRETDARAFFDANREEMLKSTKVLWPEGDPYYDLMIQKVTKLSSFLTEKQNASVDTSKIYITEEQLHFEDFRRNLDIKKIISTRCDFFGAIDPSLGKKSTKGDYSAIVTLAIDRKSGYMFVVDIDAKRRSVDDQIEIILKKHEKYHYRLFAVETNAFQYVVADALRKLSKKKGIYVPVKDVNQYQDKAMRFEGVLPFLLDGTIVFDSNKKNQNQMYDLGIEQICTFTGENDKHDDVPDCLATVFEIAKKKRFKMITRQAK